MLIDMIENKILDLERKLLIASIFKIYVFILEVSLGVDIRLDILVKILTLSYYLILNQELIVMR